MPWWGWAAAAVGGFLVWRHQAAKAAAAAGAAQLAAAGTTQYPTGGYASAIYADGLDPWAITNDQGQTSTGIVADQPAPVSVGNPGGTGGVTAGINPPPANMVSAGSSVANPPGSGQLTDPGLFPSGFSVITDPGFHFSTRGVVTGGPGTGSVPVSAVAGLAARS